MRRIELAGIALSFLVTGCAGSGIPRGPEPAAPPPQPAQQAVAAPGSGESLTLEAIQNASFPLPEANGNLIKFTDGKFRGAVVAGSLEEIRLNILDRVGRGDLDGDGVEDAALLMVKDPTGETPEYTLWAVINLGGIPDPRSSFLLGTDVQVGAITVEDLKIFINVVRPEPYDVPGTPTRRIKESYKLFGNRLERADTFR